jgi:MFS family permease
LDFAAGALLVLVPLYQSEISPPKIRGFLVAMHGVLIVTGYSIAGWVGLGFYFVDAGGAQWRLPLALQCLWPAILAAGVLYLPESPRWLIDHDQHDNALKAFKQVRAETNDDILDDDAAINADFAVLNEQIAFEKQNPVSLMDLVRLPHYRKRVIVGVITMVAPQLTGTQIIYSMCYRALLPSILELCQLNSRLWISAI